MFQSPSTITELHLCLPPWIIVTDGNGVCDDRWTIQHKTQYVEADAQQRASKVFAEHSLSNSLVSAFGQPPIGEYRENARRSFGTIGSAGRRSSHLDSSAFQASLTHGYGQQISPNKGLYGSDGSKKLLARRGLGYRHRYLLKRT
jgi:hypothetical protein